VSESFKVESNQTANNNYYARVLRVIGQDLAELFPAQLEIEREGRSFVANVRCDRKRAEVKAPPEPAKSGFGGIIHKLANYRLDKAPEKPELVNVTRNYAPNDISRIDEVGLHRRFQLGKIPDIHNLGEALRTIGRIIDSEDGQLTKIFKDQRRVIFEYIAKGGETRKVEMTLTELYKAQQSYYQTRSANQSLDLWKNKK
jgi:hypothetical protein